MKMITRLNMKGPATAMFLGIALAVALAASPVLAQEKITLSFAHEDSAGERRDRAAHDFADLVYEYTDGLVEINVFPSGQLGNYSQIVEGMQIGTHDITSTLALVIGLAPQLGVFDLPYLFADRESFERAINSPIGDRILDTLQDRGLVGLAYKENGYRHVTNNVRPVVTPEDLDGVKLRTPPSPTRVAMFQQFGANPGPLPFTELYSALQQGVFDGQENPLPNIRGAKLYEVQRYLSLTGHVYDPQILVISKLRWDAMSEEIQDAMLRAGREVAASMRAEGQRLDDEDLAYLSQHMEVNEVDFEAFQSASQPLYDSFAYPELLQELLEAAR
jgi:TRAP-type transport system periplasmic protein